MAEEWLEEAVSPDSQSTQSTIRPRDYWAVEVLDLRGDSVLSLVRSDTTGEVELRGNSSQFKDFAAMLRGGEDMSVGPRRGL